MENLKVVLITKDAAKLEVLHDADYVRMVQSLNSPLYGWSYQRIADATGQNTKAYWQMVAKKERQLNPATRKALRNVGEIKEELPPIPDPPQLVAETEFDENALMVRIGLREPGERVKRVLMLADDGDMVINVNGEITAYRRPAPSQAVTSRPPVYRPVLSLDLKQRIIESGRTVEELIESALQEVTR